MDDKELIAILTEESEMLRSEALGLEAIGMLLQEITGIFKKSMLISFSSLLSSSMKMLD